jgi:8-oxo-dGTP pyrophosphatase MutT (NUDIX family)
MSGEAEWVARLRASLASPPTASWAAATPPGAVSAAVLVLLVEGRDGPEVLLVERAGTLRSHAGQMAFPGGAVEPGDSDAVATALREAHEEVGLGGETPPANVEALGVEVLGVLPPTWIAASNFEVTAVVALWSAPTVLLPDGGEVVRALWVPLHELADPAGRYRVELMNGYFGAAFQLETGLVWGFTAGILDVVLRLGGWERPWSRRRVLPRPE